MDLELLWILGEFRQHVLGATAHVHRLHDPVVTVTFTVTNNGTIAGTEVSLLL